MMSFLPSCLKNQHREMEECVKSSCTSTKTYTNLVSHNITHILSAGYHGNIKIRVSVVLHPSVTYYEVLKMVDRLAIS